MTDSPVEPRALEFEHLGTMTCGDRLLICDVEYFPTKFAGTTQAKVSLAPEIEILPGVWQVLLAYDPSEVPDADGDGPAPKFLLLSHDQELETESPLEHAESVALLRIDSGRLTIIDPDLRDDDSMQTAVLEAPRDQVPCMLRALDAQPDEGPRGALVDVDVSGVFELHAAPGHPRTALFLSL